ncbi:hypothetical protein GN244_ATG07320 [Phytophthora infestans]|uniref:Uncharacterized protein n=1 Tax=Phytophthora infestans TaxID=4787 RepID=A0A833W322_PHYIN|nr:hypothetical protein GN244_ATG07320 [Phytophthora infestans]
MEVTPVSTVQIKNQKMKFNRGLPSAFSETRYLTTESTTNHEDNEEVRLGGSWLTKLTSASKKNRATLNKLESMEKNQRFRQQLVQDPALT